MSRSNQEISYVIEEAEIGRVLVARTRSGVCAVLIGDGDEELEGDLRRRFPGATFVRQEGPAGSEGPSDPVVAALAGNTTSEVALDLAGTDFQQRVWEALRAIPPGTTVTYSDIAAAIGRPDAVRAVGGAIAANPIAVLVPCHRVVPRGGSVGGYRWGPDRKRRLLALEGVPGYDATGPE